MSKKQINVEELITKATKEAAKEAVNELRNSNMIKNGMSYFRRVELLLINYNNLKNAIKQKEEDIEFIEKNGLPQRSGSIVIYQTGGGNISGQERYTQMIEQYKIENIETERAINKIDNALSTIKKDKYYDIIVFKYLVNEEERMTDEQIAEKFNKDQSTISRNKNRLINILKATLFPKSSTELLL